MARLIPFEISHIRKMQLGDNQLSFGLDTTIEAYAKANGPALTMMDGEKVIVSAGITRLWPGLGEAWAILSEDVFGYPLSFHRYVKRHFPAMIKDGKFHRVQAFVLEGFDKGAQWVYNLGFEYEGIARKYGPNKENYLRFVILR